MALKTHDMQVTDHVQFLCLEHPTTNNLQLWPRGIMYSDKDELWK